MRGATRAGFGRRASDGGGGDDGFSVLDGLPAPARAAAAALGAVLLSAAVVVTPVFLVWMTSDFSAGSGWQAVQTGLNGWLFAHGVPLSLAGKPVSLIPWLLAGVPLFAAAWCTQWAIRLLPGGADAAGVRRIEPLGGLRRDVALSGVCFVGTYLVLSVIARYLARLEWLQASLPWTLWCSFVVAVLGFVAGVRMEQGNGTGTLAPRLAARWEALVPLWARRSVRPAIRAVLVLLVLGALMTVALVLVRFSRVSGLYGELGVAPASGAVLTVAQLLYLPNAAVWALSWLAGPGFGLGTDSSITMLQADPGLLPLIPFLGALPEPGKMPGIAAAAPLVLVALGALLGWYALRGIATLSSWRMKLWTVLATVGLTGVLMAVLGVLATGAVGEQRLAHIGVPWWFALPLTAELLVGALIVWALDVLRLKRG